MRGNAGVRLLMAVAGVVLGLLHAGYRALLFALTLVLRAHSSRREIAADDVTADLTGAGRSRRSSGRSIARRVPAASSRRCSSTVTRRGR